MLRQENVVIDRGRSVPKRWQARLVAGRMYVFSNADKITIMVMSYCCTRDLRIMVVLLVADLSIGQIWYIGNLYISSALFWALASFNKLLPYP